MAGSRGLGRHGRMSTGPKTSAGKAICAQNARSHGLTRFVPDHEASRCLTDAIMQHFGIAEADRYLAACLADAELRLQNVQRTVSRSFFEGVGQSFSAKMAARYLSAAEARRQSALSTLLATKAGG